jgi:hypothetical protein
MIFWSLCAFILFKNIEKMLLQMTSGFLQLESLLECFFKFGVKVGVGESIETHHTRNSVKFKQLIRDPLSV